MNLIMDIHRSDMKMALERGGGWIKIALDNAQYKLKRFKEDIRRERKRCRKAWFRARDGQMAVRKWYIKSHAYHYGNIAVLNVYIKELETDILTLILLSNSQNKPTE